MRASFESGARPDAPPRMLAVGQAGARLPSGRHADKDEMPAKHEFLRALSAEFMHRPGKPRDRAWRRPMRLAADSSTEVKWRVTERGRPRRAVAEDESLSPDRALGQALEILARAKKGIDSRGLGGLERGRARHGRSRPRILGGARAGSLQAEEHHRSARLSGGPVIGETSAREVRRKGVAALHSGPPRRAPSGQLDPRGAVEYVLPRRGLRPAPGRARPLPACRGLQGASARALAVGRGNGTVGQGAMQDRG